MSEEQPEANTMPIPERDGRQLIAEAFEVARASGRDDWTEMTTAVLKNRLLDLTERAFNEADYGARTISELVEKFPDLVALNKDTKPPKVSLINISQLERGTPYPARVTRGRIRPDLWRAIIDYRSGSSYYWDGTQAVPMNTEFAEERGLEKLPTLLREEMKSWRDNFRKNLPRLATLDTSEAEQVNNWVDQSLPTSELPIQARSLWNDSLNDQVVDRLRKWFRERSLPTPDGMTQQRPTHRDAPPVGVAQLRELILRCVRSMTEAELRTMALPPAAVLRAFGGAESGLRSGLGKQGDA
ncbi:hypothetical protein ACH4N4_14300 [Streptomyces microflavus]|uniref:hypothetical protein n=1 Tax=Streptomyces microflavus TaxID=1919 RepID=UPI0037AA05C0